MKFNYILVFALLFIGFAFAQENDKYFLVTIETETKPNMHGMNTYYWIIPVDSIKNFHNFKVYPFYLDWASNDNYERCMDGKPISIFTSTILSNYDYPESYKSKLKELGEIIKSERRLVQTTIKRYSISYKEKIRIYLTPISGKFCHCSVRKGSILDKNFKYNGEIYLPVSNFKFEIGLWDTEQGKDMLYSDLEKSTFDNKI